MSRLRTDGIVYLSPSQLRTLTLCERKWALGVPEPTTEALAMGAGFAMALDRGIEHGITAYLESRPQPDEFTDPDVDERARLIGCATVRHAAECYMARVGGERIEREVTYLTQIPGTESLFQVRIDGVGEHYLVEDKLRSGAAMRPDLIENEIRQGSQLLAEVWVHRRVTGQNLPVRLRNVKKCDPRKLKTVGLDEIDGIVAEHFQGESVFDERDAYFDADRLDGFANELVSAAQRARLLGPASALRNTEACFTYGRPCAALSRCQGAQDNQEMRV